MNYYSILEINSDASIEEIKKSYYKLALKYHPDRNINKSPEEIKENEIKFKQINEAYVNLCQNKNINLENDSFFQTFFDKYNLKLPEEFIKLSEKLLSPEKRKKINDSINKISKILTDPNEMSLYNEFYQSVKTNSKNKNNKKYEKNYDTKILSRYNQNIITKTDDLIFNLNVNIKDIYNSNIKSFTTKINRKCLNCNGLGYITKINLDKELCPRCNGVMVQPQNIDISFNCSDNEIILAQQSNYEVNKIPGDVIININPKKSNFKIINEYDLIHNINISLLEAYAGYKLNFTHLDDNLYNINFIEPILNKRIKKICNLGLLKDNNTRGDLFIKFNILLPRLNDYQIELLKKYNLSIQNKSLFDNIDLNLDSIENINTNICFNHI